MRISGASLCARLALLCMVFLTSACGGGGGGAHESSELPTSQLLPSVVTPSVAPSTSGVALANTDAVTVRLKYILGTNNSTQSGHRSLEYISPSNTLISITVTPLGGSPTIYGPSPCMSGACSVTFTAVPGPVTIAFTLTDGSSNVLSKFSTTTIVQPSVINTLNFTANPVVNSVALALANPTLNAGTAANDALTVIAKDAANNTIVGPGNYVDVNGNPVAFSLSVVNNQAGGNGNLTILGPMRITGPNQVPPVAHYDGKWLASSTIFVTSSSSAVTTLTPVTFTTIPTAVEYNPGTGLYGIANGSDGNLWFTTAGPNVGKITPRGITQMIPCVGCTTTLSMTPGPDGNVWFGEDAGSYIDKVTPSGVVTRVYNTSGSTRGIFTGPDGNIWYSSPFTSQIGAVSTNGSAQNYGIGVPPGEITRGPDGAMWFTTRNGTIIGKISTSGQLLWTATVGAFGNYDGGIVTGPDGNIWVTDGNSNLVYQVTPQGSMTTYTPAAGTNPRRAIVGPDGNIWFGCTGGLCNITTAGVFSPTYSSGLSAIALGLTVGPDGNIWYVTSNRIGKFVY